MSHRPSFRMRLIAASVSGLMLIGMIILGVTAVQSARRDAMRASVYGGLCQLHLAVANYEAKHGSLPPAFGPDGQRNLNWLAYVLQEIDEEAVLSELDFTQPWDSPRNQAAVDRSPFLKDWRSFQDGSTACVLSDSASLWDGDTGQPRGTLSELPDSIVFIAVPNLRVGVLEPYQIGATAIRQFVEQGEEVLYVTSSRRYGRVTEDRKQYLTYQVDTGHIVPPEGLVDRAAEWWNQFLGHPITVNRRTGTQASRPLLSEER